MSDRVDIPEWGIWSGLAAFIAGVIGAAWKTYQQVVAMQKTPKQLREMAQIIETMSGWVAEDLRTKTLPLTPTENYRLKVLDEKVSPMLRAMELGNGH